MDARSAERKTDFAAKQPRVLVIVRFRAFCAALSACIGALILLGYAMRFEPAWRPLAGHPATNPGTALCILLLGLGVSLGMREGRLIRLVARVTLFGAIAFLLVRLAAPLIGTAPIEAITPFHSVVAADRAAGNVNRIGTHVAGVLLALAMADVLRSRGFAKLSQMMACLAIAVATVAVAGYVDRHRDFVGGMAPWTFLSVSLLSTTMLIAMPRQGFVRALLSGSIPGRLARALLACTTVTILIIGWLAKQYIDGPGFGLPADTTVLIYQTAAVTITVWLVIVIWLVSADRIDRRRRASEHALDLAESTDALTGLFSRSKMLDLREALQRAPAHASVKLFIDLDRFRSVNEAFGAAAGDAVLVEVGRRLVSIAGGYPVGRLGGDEFAIYGSDITLPEAEALAAAVVDVMARPFDVAGRSFRLTTSVGIAHTDAIGDMRLPQAASDALYVAKRRGGNQAVTFARSMHEERKAQAELEQDLYAALEGEDQLAIAYQPIVRLNDHATIAIEALARWTHPRLGAIPPNRFIALAERTGLIATLGRKLMGLVVEQAASWHGTCPAGVPVININVSPAQFESGDPLGDLVSLVATYRLAASNFCIEVTEGAFTGEQAVNALREARRLGFKVAMDDFGVGYSSLAQLPRLPLSTVKLDRSFIIDAVESNGHAAILVAITQLAHALNLTVVAEGVETTEQLDLVTAAGCDAIQGYLVSRPIAAQALRAWLDEQPSIVPSRIATSREMKSARG